MKLVFYSNFLNDHQLPLCLEFVKLLGDGNFFFVAHQEISQERLNLGFDDMNEKYSFVIKSYKGGQEESIAQDLMLKADVVIIGSYKNMPFEERMRLNKLTFRYNERILKKGDIYWFDPRLHRAIYRGWTKHKSKKLYTLCASAYTARDLSLFGYPKDKCIPWGYFPEVKDYGNIENLFKIKYKSTNEAVTMLWVGRLIDWKHPDHAIKIALKLKNDGYKFVLNIIGVGTMQSALQKMIQDLNLQNCVHMLGSVPPSKVREYMESSQIFLFTSDKNEGWGAVLNEAMNSGCAVVANINIGSVPFMLKNNENGLIYSGDINDLYNKVCSLFTDFNLTRKLGESAYISMIEKWNAKVASQRFISIVSSLL